MLGIEYDGMAYHSLPVARDRDRIRKDILRGRGLDIYRIWSQSWFQDRASAIRKLEQALEASQRKHIS